MRAKRSAAAPEFERACGRTGRAGLILGQPAQHQELGGERESDFAQT